MDLPGQKICFNISLVLYIGIRHVLLEKKLDSLTCLYRVTGGDVSIFYSQTSYKILTNHDSEYESMVNLIELCIIFLVAFLCGQ